MRMFVAIDLPDEIRAVIGEVVQYLRRRNLFEGTFVDPTTAHMTVAFLGDINEDQQADIILALQTLEPPDYPAYLGQVDYFERNDQVRVIFVSVICPELATFVQRIHAVLEPWYEPDSRGFTSHVTVARVNRCHNHQELRQKIADYHVPRTDFHISSFDLKKSELTPEGPVHKTIYGSGS